jgi:hypothetical protein
VGRRPNGQRVCGHWESYTWEGLLELGQGRIWMPGIKDSLYPGGKGSPMRDVKQGTTQS